MKLRRDLYDQVIAHCQAERPREACGVLAGPDGADPTEWHPIGNAAEFPGFRYAFAEDEQLQLWADLDSRGLRPLTVVHSHVIKSTHPSVEDVRLAVDPTLTHLIVSLAGVPLVDLWRLRPNERPADQVEQLRLEII